MMATLARTTVAVNSQDVFTHLTCVTDPPHAPTTDALVLFPVDNLIVDPLHLWTAMTDPLAQWTLVCKTLDVST